MNSLVRDKWVAALKSGEYKQGKNALRDGDTFCCLGVLCEVAVKEGVIPPPMLITTLDGVDSRYKYGNDDGGGVFHLPEAVKTWAEVSSGAPEVTTAFDDVRVELVRLNDSENWTFDEIANAIKEGDVR